MFRPTSQYPTRRRLPTILLAMQYIAGGGAILALVTALGIVLESRSAEQYVDHSDGAIWWRRGSVVSDTAWVGVPLYELVYGPHPYFVYYGPPVLDEYGVEEPEPAWEIPERPLPPHLLDALARMDLSRSHPDLVVFSAEYGWPMRWVGYFHSRSDCTAAEGVVVGAIPLGRFDPPTDTRAIPYRIKVPALLVNIVLYSALVLCMQKVASGLHRRFRTRRRRCPECAYDLSHSTGLLCPECGWQPSAGMESRQVASESCH